jgi:hypothetical protein
MLSKEKSMERYFLAQRIKRAGAKDARLAKSESQLSTGSVYGGLLASW